MGDLKQKYNALLKRYRNAEKWIDDPARTREEIEKYYGHYLQIINGLNHYLAQLKRMGVFPTTKEILEGFILERP
ncbi:hypothetical protein [Thermotalea metallivorans]|uniref:Uncharacterized protein n=1 Tax=Thermotalea metallivorans TaxID=520762 RepID=A0A140LCJ0_9FIRM|nr:hypothetical protein [Thermotalea metallivorans]KXG78265.1 hypothetical protein AN619_02400 [Thermotalea metallivorans]